MVYEVIGKAAMYIIGTLLFGALFTSWLDDMRGDWGIFFGAWLASIVVFLTLTYHECRARGISAVADDFCKRGERKDGDGNG